MRRAVAAAAGLAGLCVAVPTPAAQAAAIVAHDQEACFLAPGDIPAIPNGGLLGDGVPTIVVTPGGGITARCSGRVPDGVSVAETVHGTLTCFASDTVSVVGKYVATKGGRVQYTCHFPKGSL